MVVVAQAGSGLGCVCGFKGWVCPDEELAPISFFCECCPYISVSAVLTVAEARLTFSAAGLTVHYRSLEMCDESPTLDKYSEGRGMDESPLIMTRQLGLGPRRAMCAKQGLLLTGKPPHPQ